MRTNNRYQIDLRYILPWAVLAIILASLSWDMLFIKLDHDKALARQNGFRQATALANSYAEQLSRTMEQIDQITLTIRYYWKETGGTLRLEDQVRAGLYPLNSWLFVTIADRNGELITSTFPFKKGMSVAGKNWFEQPRFNASDAISIFPAEIGPRVGKPIIRLSRKLLAEDGAFDGVVWVAVHPDYLTSFQDQQSLGKGDFVTVNIKNGPVLAAKVGQNRGQAQIFYRENPVFDAFGGVMEEPGEKFQDNEARVVAWKKLENYPLIAVAALSETDAFAAFDKMAQSYRQIAVVGTAFLILFALVGMGFSVHLGWRKRHAENVKNTYRLAVDGAQEGFYMMRPVFGRSRNIIDFRVEDCNERAAAMVGLGKHQMVGRRISDILSEGQRRGMFAVLQRTLETGFYEEEFRVPATSPLKASWIYRRFVRAGDGIALTLRDISEAKAHEQALSNQANTDPLTKLPNRHWLMDQLPTTISHAGSGNRQLAILFIDLDNFKNINDTLGHDAGDELLKNTALRLKSTVRAFDHVVRLGGDEFTVILEQVDMIENVSRIAEQIVKSVSAPFTLAGISDNRVSASIGISLFPQDGADAETLLKHADIAMYAAKAAGKGRYHFYHSHLSDTLVLKLNKEAALQQAVERDEFLMHYQPRVGTNTGKMSSMEALLRWMHPKRGLTLPEEFIDVAEDTGLILRIGEIVIEKVCAQIAEWKSRDLVLVPVSINVSGLQLKSGNLSGFLQDALRRHDIASSLIEIELTESSMIGKEKTVIDELKAIRAMGIKLLIDDFGIGYSSLSQLQQLDVDILKVDRAFTESLCKSAEGMAFFKAIISMADALNIGTVAEGVETAEQVRTLQALSCEEIQGHFVSRAVPAAEIPALMLKSFLFPSSVLRITAALT